MTSRYRIITSKINSLTGCRHPWSFSLVAHSCLPLTITRLIRSTRRALVHRYHKRTSLYSALPVFIRTRPDFRSIQAAQNEDGSHAKVCVQTRAVKQIASSKTDRDRISLNSRHTLLYHSL